MLFGLTARFGSFPLTCYSHFKVCHMLCIRRKGRLIKVWKPLWIQAYTAGERELIAHLVCEQLELKAAHELVAWWGRFFSNLNAVHDVCEVHIEDTRDSGCSFVLIRGGEMSKWWTTFGVLTNKHPALNPKLQGYMYNKFTPATPFVRGTFGAASPIGPLRIPFTRAPQRLSHVESWGCPLCAQSSGLRGKAKAACLAHRNTLRNSAHSISFGIHYEWWWWWVAYHACPSATPCLWFRLLE